MPILNRVPLVLCLLVFAVAGPGVAQSADDDAGLRLYVLDGGELESSPASYDLLDSEVATTSLALSAFLIVHPRGALLWEAGAVPDSERVMEGEGARQIVIRSDEAERPVILGPSLLGQLAEIGYGPDDIDYLALSHFHWDHSANANTFAHATWLVRPEERAAMFPDAPLHNSARPMTYAALRDSDTVLITDEEFDVFGDGLVILKAARGHSPGHQVIYLNLPETGGVVLSGDLYHYPEERTLNRFPARDFDVEQTRAARADLEAFLVRHNATLWIEHDLIAHRQLRKAPAFYR
jgi:N-acyl homoserine lactone hydrolase